MLKYYSQGNALEKESTFELFPNPTTGSFFIQNMDMGDYHLTISDMKGKELKTYNVDSGLKELNLSGLSSGSYFVTIKVGDKLIVKPLVKL